MNQTPTKTTGMLKGAGGKVHLSGWNVSGSPPMMFEENSSTSSMPSVDSSGNSAVEDPVELAPALAAIEQVGGDVAHRVDDQHHVADHVAIDVVLVLPRCVRAGRTSRPRGPA